MTNGEHFCLACNFVVIPVYRAFCRHCFPKVPWRLRADVMHAYRRRVLRGPEFDKQLIQLRQWVHDSGKGKGRDE
ncbi:MAG: hypothetical protein ABWX96_17590 [Propionibacteriaceae bacterium]